MLVQTRFNRLIRKVTGSNISLTFQIFYTDSNKIKPILLNIPNQSVTLLSKQCQQISKHIKNKTISK